MTIGDSIANSPLTDAYFTDVMNSANTHVTEQFDVIIVGGGAAGLMCALQLVEMRPVTRIAILDGAKRLGAKILISGGGRCNITNRSVTANDFSGGSRNVIKRVLRAFSVKETLNLFERLGIRVHEEEYGKLFPDSNKARSVLDALLTHVDRANVHLLTNHRVDDITRVENGFHVATSEQRISSRIVVLATGGKSVPKTGSDGFGFCLAQNLGHRITPTFPALVPLLLNGDFHTPLSGISMDVELSLRAQGKVIFSSAGALLWTHFGISGPVVLDASRHWCAVNLSSDAPSLSANFFPRLSREQLNEQFLTWAKQQPSQTVRRRLSQELPNRFVDRMFETLSLSSEMTFANLTKSVRRELVQFLSAFTFDVRNHRGFQYAEATAGGIPLDEINPATFESRCCDDLFFSGEILDVDGRLGGFNFQWAWSSATVAAAGISRKLNSLGS